MRGVVACFGFAAMSLVVTRAHAELWGEARAGLGIASGHYVFEKGYTNDMNLPGVVHDEGGPLGVPVALGLIGGYAVSDGVAVALAVRAEVTPYAVRIEPRYTTLGGHLLLGVGPMLAFRPGKSLDLRLGLELATASFLGARALEDAEDNIVEIERVSGPGAVFSFGCCSEPGFGVASELRVARLVAAHTTFLPVSFTVMATLATR